MNCPITVLIPSSPVASHPSTALITETLVSVRYHLSDAQIIVMLDGVRQEQKHMYGKYLQYMRNLADNPIFFRPNVSLIPFTDHEHQVGLLRKTLPRVETPLILFLEHDVPLVTDYVLPMKEITEAILSGDVNSIRFLHESHILDEHRYLMCGEMESHGVPLTKTIQFSARPHVASVEFYKKVLAQFSPEAKSFTEDKMHSVCQCAPWEDWKLALYTPHDSNQKRSYHTDGRAGAKKFDETQVF